MKKLHIVLKYPDSARLWRVWADSENEIDFRHDPAAGARCTAAYAASELKYFLGKAMPGLEIGIGERPPEDACFIELEIQGNDFTGSFELEPQENGIRVTGYGRNGLLNGIYELLRIQGWRWLEPGIYGEAAPANPTLDFLTAKGKFAPSFRHRMIDQYRESDDSADLLRWFSRNRVNTVFRKAATGKLADKLGMLSRKGGHLLQKIMAPDTPMEDGRTIWEAHPDWYGLPADGKRDKALAMKTQLCLSNGEMIRWLSARICTILRTEMKDIDILDLWGFDTWGKTCSCPHCADLGNGSDQNLRLLSAIQAYLQRHLDRPVMLNTISYEGTATMSPPTRPAPRNLIDTGCMVIFYPIKRCYRHQLKDRSCTLNQVYDDSMTGWHRMAPELALWSGEYYNVSKYEDLPLVFGRLIPAEMRYYHARGCTGATYMHNLSPNWGVRALTQLMHTQFAWDVDMDEDAFLSEYFERKYGRYAARMRKIYGRLEAAGKDIALRRNWGDSLLTRLLQMEGNRPAEEITAAHYAGEAELLQALKEAVRNADAAVSGLRQVLAAEQRRNWKDLPAIRDIPPVVTPLELEKLRYYDKMEYRIGEDLRGALYGAEILRLEYVLLNYHNALRLGRRGSREWLAVEKTAARLNEWYIPLTYENPTPGVQIKDGLSRSQLRMCITRCRGARIKAVNSKIKRKD
ncbi:MAG: DUF4838 domain-containing protein [Lentisphaerae bacterium]|nr:DUF4838 domain-containing protein [Lentisphaerota bacterium]